MTVMSSCVLITGATGLVGRGLATHFAGRGYRVALTARDSGRLESLAAEIGAAAWQSSDLADAASLKRLVEHLDAASASPDVLINNAADVTSKPLLDTALDEIDHLLRVNVIGALQLTRLIAPSMISRGNGTIVNISSLAGFKPNRAQTVYSVSKSAVNAMSEALRAELGPRGIHCVNVALMGVGDGPGRVSMDVVARRIARAINDREPDVFFYWRTKWLMRLYGALPALMRR
ncbi:MAG: SDR family NAD(P)-dependent oxidoreductase [Candidatus Hydrogenedentes bacterium]|nr:SDR family NAD(P)-dependent oxidoreductase [Candidatus Hydrogenedentota bacterium]